MLLTVLKMASGGDARLTLFKCNHDEDVEKQMSPWKCLRNRHWVSKLADRAYPCWSAPLSFRTLNLRVVFYIFREAYDSKCKREDLSDYTLTVFVHQSSFITTLPTCSKRIRSPSRQLRVCLRDCYQVGLTSPPPLLQSSRLSAASQQHGLPLERRKG